MHDSVVNSPPGHKPAVTTAKRLGDWAARVAAVAWLFFIEGPVLAHLEIVPGLVGFWVMLGGVGMAVVAAMLGLVARMMGTPPNGVLGLGFGGGMLVVAVLAISGGRVESPVTEATTDFENPPNFFRAPTLATTEQMPPPQRSFVLLPADLTALKAAHPDLGPLRLPRSPADAFELALAVASARPEWQITYVDRNTKTFEGVAVTRLLRFRDDFVVRVTPDAPAGAASPSPTARIDMRSRSRVGDSDHGANAARIRAFFRELQRAAQMR